MEKAIVTSPIVFAVLLLIFIGIWQGFDVDPMLMFPFLLIVFGAPLLILLYGFLSEL